MKITKLLFQGVLILIFSLGFSVAQAQSIQKKELTKAESQKLKSIGYGTSVNLQTPEQDRKELAAKLKLQEVGSPAYLKLKAKLVALDKKLEEQ